MNVKSITAMTEDNMCPPISDTTVLENILKNDYGFTTTSLSPLNCYEDLNFHIKVKEEHSNPNLAEGTVREIIMKIINPEDSKVFDYVDSQRLLTAHLNKHGITAQTEIKNLKGDFFSQITLSRKGLQYKCLVSVRTFLSGEIVAQHTLTPPLLYQLGSFLAAYDNALLEFKCEFYDRFDCLWCLNNFLKVREVVHIIQDAEQRKVVNEILDLFETQVQPMMKDFHRGTIHGDPNEQNILVVPDSQSPSGVAISGVLDYQESSMAYHIYDVAAMAAYMMMHTKTSVTPVDTAGYVLAGYTGKEPLNASERRCFRALIAARMAMSLTYGAYVHSHNPTNIYLLTTAQVGWSVLTKFWLTPKDDVEKRWDEILGSYVYEK